MKNKHNSAFTIVELLVVIVVIGILAAITIVSYSGIQTKAIAAGLQNDLDSNAKLLKLYNVEYGYYPSAISPSSYCPTSPIADSKYCLKAMSGTSLNYSGGEQSFNLVETHTASSLAYKITENSSAVAYSVADSFIKTSGTTYSDTSNSLIELNDGSLIVVGETSSVGNGDGSIQKYSPTGVLLWSKTFGSATGIESTQDVIKTIDGGFATAGYTNGYGANGNDMLIAKFDSSGNLQWSRIWGNTSDDRAYSIGQNSDGDIYVGGYDVTNDAILAKYDSAGNFIWNKLIATAGDDTAIGLAITDDKGIVFVGQGSWSGVRVTRLLADGTISWDKIWDGTGLDRLVSVIRTADNGYLASGYSNSFGSDHNTILVKLSSDGSLNWMRTIDAGSNTEIGGGLVELSDGSVISSGSTKSVGFGSYDSYLLKLNAAGSFVWGKIFGGNNDDVSASRLVKTIDGGYVLAGFTKSSGITYGNNDMFIAKYKADGSLPNCSNSYCLSQTFTVNNQAISFSNGGSTSSNPSALKSDTTASTVVASYNPSTSIIAAP